MLPTVGVVLVGCRSKAPCLDSVAHSMFKSRVYIKPQTVNSTRKSYFPGPMELPLEASSQQVDFSSDET